MQSQSSFLAESESLVWQSHCLWSLGCLVACSGSLVGESELLCVESEVLGCKVGVTWLWGWLVCRVGFAGGEECL